MSPFIDLRRRFGSVGTLQQVVPFWPGRKYSSLLTRVLRE
jgi:hypothetical protein